MRHPVEGWTHWLRANQGLLCWLEGEFWNAPVEDFGDVEFGFGGAGHFVNPAELA